MDTAAAGQEGGLASYKLLVFAGDEVIGDARAFILSKWLRSLRYENDFFRLITGEFYWPAYQKRVKHILADPETQVALAVLSDDPDVILGFSVWRKNALDYVYVHKHQRRQGIARSLVPAGIDTLTHLTKNALTIWGRHDRVKGWKFDPFR